MNSNKIPYIIYADIESLTRKIDGCENIQKILQQQKQASTFLADIQYQQFGDLIIWKTNIFISWKRLCEKVL